MLQAVIAPPPPATSPPPPSPLPPPPAPSPPPFDGPFPCVPVTPCEDDPDFLLFSIFTCTTAPIDPCTDPQAVIACGLTCFSCPICEDPQVPDPFDIVIQTALITPNVLSVFIDNEVVLSGAQAQVGCVSNGEWVGTATGAAFVFQPLWQGRCNVTEEAETVLA